ncbi:bifunctional DNA primase/polymerase [Ruegeria sp. HKCCD6604]|uniref:bifunctional DNA primase/polymerase n=1 Tax=Ruegeria sp. HKCCD6604 TaxID=2683000 RepID=UPI0014923A1A|nr:bifunctional DNA primase/polymerase [Ruegeria sp. HKCCD6604]NOC91927.1 hypothetical protein [Ruegeria sp. HKCCD6604]
MTEQKTQNLSANLSPAIAAKAYVKMGWEPLRLPPNSKKPAGNWGESRKWEDADIDAAFSPDSNIGVALGARSNGLADIDLDIAEAIPIADQILGDFVAFGRMSSPRSHRVAMTTPMKSTRFQIPPKAAKSLKFGRSVVLEIRSDGAQTMFPPSMHPEGEQVQWMGDPTKIPTVPAEELKKRCGICAALAVVLRFYPRHQGDRDNICLALTGTLIRTELSDEEVDRLVVAVAFAAGDDEAENRGGKSLASREKLRAGDPIWGLPELCDRLDIQELENTLRKWIGLKSEGFSRSKNNANPTILVEAGNLPEEVDHAEGALIEAKADVYQRGEQLVRVSRIPKQISAEGIERPGGALVLTRVVSPWLREKFARVANWEKVTKDGSVPVHPPYEHAAAYLARVGEWRVPVLTGMISTPTLRADGSILQQPGFDYESGLLYNPQGFEFEPVPDAPSRNDALNSLPTLLMPFREFPFAESVDKSVLLAATLTALMRRSLRTAPLFAIDAPTAGSGKTYIAQTIGIIASGHTPTIISQGKSDEEDEKRIATVLIAGDSNVVIDNCERPIGGDTLCAVLTTDIWAARILGKSELARTPTNALFMATGNNLVIAGDMARRTLVCRLDPRTEHPELAEHDFDPRVEAEEKRAALVSAGLTVLRAYIAAGQPKQSSPLGSFREWNLIRDAIIWLGLPDPVITVERNKIDDPQKSELANLLHVWEAALGQQAKCLAEIGVMAEENKSHKIGDLYRALASMTRGGQFNAKSIGRLLMKHKDRIVNGRVLRAESDSAGSKLYRVEVVGRSETAYERQPPDDFPF